MQRQRGELVPIGDALAGMGGPVQALRETPTTGAAGLHPRRSGTPVGRGQRSGPGARLHGANDGALLVAPQQTPATGFNTNASTVPIRST